MWTYLPIVFLPALLVVAVCKYVWPHDITLKEWALQGVGVVISTLLCMLIIGASSFSVIGDTAIFNGFVIREAEYAVYEELISLPARAFTDPAYKHLMDKLDATSGIETLITKLAPEATYEHGETRVKMYGEWYTVMSH